MRICVESYHKPLCLAPTLRPALVTLDARRPRGNRLRAPDAAPRGASAFVTVVS